MTFDPFDFAGRVTNAIHAVPSWRVNSVEGPHLAVDHDTVVAALRIYKLADTIGTPWLSEANAVKGEVCKTLRSIGAQYGVVP